jgi:hypothetical protein
VRYSVQRSKARHYSGFSASHCQFPHASPLFFFFFFLYDASKAAQSTAMTEHRLPVKQLAILCTLVLNLCLREN